MTDVRIPDRMAPLLQDNDPSHDLWSLPFQPALAYLPLTSIVVNK